MTTATQVPTARERVKQLEARQRALPEVRSELERARKAALESGSLAAVREVDEQIADVDREAEMIRVALPKALRDGSAVQERERADREARVAIARDEFVAGIEPILSQALELCRQLDELRAAAPDAAADPDVPQVPLGVLACFDQVGAYLRLDWPAQRASIAVAATAARTARLHS